jgi:hypothetical protein
VARRGYDRRQVEEFVDQSRRDAAARRATWEATPQKERAAWELAALRTQAQMALARNLWWPPQQDGE